MKTSKIKKDVKELMDVCEDVHFDEVTSSDCVSDESEQKGVEVSPQNSINLGLTTQALKSIGVNIDIPSLELILSVTGAIQTQGYDISMRALNDIVNFINSKYTEDVRK